MLSTTIVHACARCGSEHIRKNGHADNGAQRAKCLECGRTFLLQPKGARYDQKFKDQVVAACQDRLSIRGITRTFGSGWPCAEEPVRSSPGLWATAACKAPATCGPRCPKGCRGRATRSDFLGRLRRRLPEKNPTALAARQRAKPTHVERWFGTLRARASRLVRRAHSFSKHAENHLDASHLFITTYNPAVQQRTTVG